MLVRKLPKDISIFINRRNMQTTPWAAWTSLILLWFIRTGGRDGGISSSEVAHLSSFLDLLEFLDVGLSDLSTSSSPYFSVYRWHKIKLISLHNNACLLHILSVFTFPSASFSVSLPLSLTWTKMIADGKRI